MEEGFSGPDDLHTFGQLLNQSHTSLRDDYEVSVPQVDLLVKLAQAQQGVIGARMTGGGFGGCTVNVVETGALDNFRAKVLEEYRSQTGLAARMYVFEGVEGGSILR
jgi:galactokinase